MFKKGDMVTGSEATKRYRVWASVIDSDGDYVHTKTGAKVIAPICSGIYLVIDSFQSNGCNLLRVFCCRTLNRLIVNESDMMRAK